MNQAAVLTVTVSYSVTGGTASGGGVNYTLSAGSLSISPGDASQTIDVAITGNAVAESEETLVLTLSDPQNAALGATTSLTLTIQEARSFIYRPLVLREAGAEP